MKINKRVRALKDCDFKNDFMNTPLVKEEVTTITLKNQEELDALLKLNIFELVGEDIPEVREIPVIYKKSSSVPAENELLATLELTGNLEKLNEN